MGSIGVLLIALGHENYYRMAVNLAASLRYNAPDIDIHLITDRIDIDERLFTSFNTLIELGLNPFACKTNLYDLSPFDKTLFLDVDMIWLPDRNPMNLFKELEGKAFTIMNAMKGEACIWADPEDVRKESGNTTDPIRIFYSELIYFERTEQTEAFFDEVKNVYQTTTITNRKFAGGMADELAYIIASLKLGVHPHMDDWQPVYWFFRNKKHAHLQPYQLKNNYYAYSIGGNNLPVYVKAHYNNLAAFYGKAAGVAKPYLAQDKRYFLSNRTKI